MSGPGLNARAAPLSDDVEGGFTSEESTRVVVMSRAKDLAEIRVSMHRKRENNVTYTLYLLRVVTGA